MIISLLQVGLYTDTDTHTGKPQVTDGRYTALIAVTVWRQDSALSKTQSARKWLTAGFTALYHRYHRAEHSHTQPVWHN